MNERTHFFIKLYISHTLFSMFLWCVRDEWRQGQTAILTQLLFLTIAALLGWGCSTGGRWGPQPSVCKLVPTLAFLCPTNLTAAGTCLYSFMTSTCFRFFSRLFTQVHLLIDGSVKGQYTTIDINTVKFQCLLVKLWLNEQMIRQELKSYNYSFLYLYHYNFIIKVIHKKLLRCKDLKKIKLK